MILLIIESSLGFITNFNIYENKTDIIKKKKIMLSKLELFIK